jgi:hypothetical protein
MNTDEKIFQALDDLRADMKELKQGQQALEAGQKALQDDVSSLQDGQQKQGERGIRLRWDSWNMTAVTQQCTACPSLAAAALEA